MREGKIEQLTTPEDSMPINDFIEDDQGNLGQIISTEIISGQKLLKVKFSNNVSYFPFARIGKDLKLIKKADLPVPKGKSLDVFLQEHYALAEKKLLEKKKTLSLQALKEYIESNQTDLKFLRLTFDEKTGEELKKIIDEANEKHMVFRGDSRHPYAKSRLDRQERNKKGPFKNGFEEEGGKHGDVVHLTANSSMAVDYPPKETMPSDWDGQRFLYFIESEIIFDKIASLDLEDIDNDELITHDIPPEYIRYAIQFDDETKKVVEIFHNPLKK